MTRAEKAARARKHEIEVLNLSGYPEKRDVVELAIERGESIVLDMGDGSSLHVRPDGKGGATLAAHDPEPDVLEHLRQIGAA